MLSVRSTRWQHRVAVVTPPLVVATFAVALFRSVERRQAANGWVEHSYRVIGHLDELRARVVDAETGQRGYVITGDTTYLGPYRHAGRDARMLLATLRAETRDNPAQQRMLDSLALLVDRRLAILEHRLDVRRTQGFEAARDSLLTGGGQQAMERIRTALARSVAEERRLLAARDRTQAADERVLLWVLFAGALAVAAVAALTGLLFARHARVQQALNDELQAQAARLEETMAELESSNDELEMQRTQLEELNLALEARTAEVETANRAKTDFLTAMSHELRTPLNAIAGYADLMEMEVPGPLTEGQRTALARIRHNEQHLLSLINDVLNYARLERGKIELHLADLPVDEVLREIGEMMEPLVEARGLALAVETCDAAVHARGDRDRVAQILLNLLSNAVKCTEAGGVRVWANAGADGVRIHVRDTGRGIAADKHEAIFDPFVQLAPEKTLTDGVGLGLSISRQLAREMHGDLSVESAPGEGATFTLTLPPARRIPAQKIVEPPAVTEDEAVAG